MPAIVCSSYVESQYLTFTAVILLSLFPQLWLITLIDNKLQISKLVLRSEFRFCAVPFKSMQSLCLVTDLGTIWIKSGGEHRPWLLSWDRLLSTVILPYSLQLYVKTCSICISGLDWSYKIMFSCSNRLWWSYSCDQDVFGA